ncbi:MAG: T9SS type A sorting domain-containing protein [Bacteroidota bacterium]
MTTRLFPIRVALRVVCSLLFSSIFFGTSVSAQEVLIPLSSNQTIKGKLLEAHGSPASARSLPVTLPFIDDFSRGDVFPRADLWLDSNVFVNSNYPDNPPTLGVATFDGIDQFGNPYNPSAGSSDKADYLTSQSIDLTSYANDTTVWFSFYYQPQGIGDAPESGDSLVLQFLDSSGTWINMWSKPGQTDTVFQRTSLRVSGRIFLHDAFQFRFYNYATVNGNRDHWHVDYVQLKANSTANDPIRDNAFFRPHLSLLDEFESMPYSHYKSLPSASAAIKTSIQDSIRNIEYGQTSFQFYSTINDQSGNNLFNVSGGTQSINSNSVVAYRTSLSGFSFPSNPGNKAEFQLKNFISLTGIQSNLDNDTIRYRQVFDNYYAYDDGSAEVGYGVTGSSGVKFAYKFDVKKQDTLRGIDMYFNPSGVNVASSLIQLCLWDQVNPSQNYDNLVYRQINQRPRNIDSINGFARYLFDTLLVVQPGPIHIGFIQNNPGLLIGLGLDRNTDHHLDMFYHTDGNWDTSSVIGSWMMRPIFGDTLYDGVIGIEEPVSGKLPFTIYPQPADDLLQIDSGDSNADNYEIYATDGRKVAEGRLENSISTKELPSGVYLLRVYSLKKGISGSRQLLISR